ncbi:MAG TPA: hypothetical protein VGI70_20935, partial [Polyangiales bacterium]
MLHELSEWLSSSDFVPYGACYGWNDAMVSVQWASNAIIGVSFIAISLTLAYLVHAGKSLPFKWMAVAFGTFIISCGVSHFLEAIVVWHAWYWLDAAVRCITALASLGTALMLPPLVPRMLALTRGAVAARDRGIELAAAVESL